MTGAADTTNGDITNGNVHAFRWSARGGMTDLGTLGGPASVGNALNDNGQVTGWGATEVEGTAHAFLSCKT